MNTDTPRTDAKITTLTCGPLKVDAVEADFARTLERELEAQIRRADGAVRAEKDVRQILDTYVGVEQERDQLLAEVAELRAWKAGKKGVEEYYQACAERDTFRAELQQISDILPKRGHDTIGAAKDVMEDLQELRAEVERLKAEAARQDAIADNTVAQRDAAEEAADKLASLILGEPIDWPFHDAKWKEAIEAATGLRAEVERLKTLGLDGIDREENLRARVAELEQDKAWLAKHVVNHTPVWFKDHACAECVPGGEIVKLGFVCAYHTAKAIDAAREKGTT